MKPIECPKGHKLEEPKDKHAWRNPWRHCKTCNTTYHFEELGVI